MYNDTDFLRQRIKELERENTLLKQQQFEITEAKELYLKIFEDFPALIWRSRLDKLCDYFNKTWLDFTGRTMEQEFGNGWTEGVHPEDFDFCLQTYVAAFDKRESFLMDYRMKNKHGDYCWIRDFGRPFYDLDDTFLGYIGSCYDITDNKINELKLIDLNATKNKFFSIIAHDLKNPVNSILGLSEHLIEFVNVKDYQQIEELAILINQSTKHAMGLLVNLMEWVQSQSGRMEFKPEYFEINTIVDEAILLLKGSADQKSIIITNALSSDLHVNADKAMVSTVLRNLISNAIKFTHPNGRVTINSVVVQNELTISVIDTGVGISKDRMDKLFKLNEGYSTQGTKKEHGTGLGLILCKEFIEKNNGKIWVGSAVGTGTTFYFSLPFVTGSKQGADLLNTNSLENEELIPII